MYWISYTNIYDVFENEIEILVDEEKAICIFDGEINVTGLLSGIYYFQLKAEDLSTRQSGAGKLPRGAGRTEFRWNLDDSVDEVKLLYNKLYFYNNFDIDSKMFFRLYSETPGTA